MIITRGYGFWAAIDYGRKEVLRLVSYLTRTINLRSEL